MSKQTTLGNPIVQLKYSLENLEVKVAFDTPKDELKQESVDAFIHRKPGSAKNDVLYIAKDFDEPLRDFAD